MAKSALIDSRTTEPRIASSLPGKNDINRANSMLEVNNIFLECKYFKNLIIRNFENLTKG